MAKYGRSVITASGHIYTVIVEPMPDGACGENCLTVWSQDAANIFDAMEYKVAKHSSGKLQVHPKRRHKPKKKVKRSA